MADFIRTQSLSFLVFFLCGMFAGALFDLLRLFRRIFPHRSFFTGLEDIGFWLFLSPFLLSLLFFFQTGRLRLFLLLALLSGVGLWLGSASRLLLGPVCRLFLFIKKKIVTFFMKISLEKTRDMNYTEERYSRNRPEKDGQETVSSRPFDK